MPDDNVTAPVISQTCTLRGVLRPQPQGKVLDLDDRLMHATIARTPEGVRRAAEHVLQMDWEHAEAVGYEVTRIRARIYSPKTDAVQDDA